MLACFNKMLEIIINLPVLKTLNYFCVCFKKP